MASLNQIEKNIRNIIRAGRLSDDEQISGREMKFKINIMRAMLIKREVDKKKTLDVETIQDLQCVPVELTDKAECCEIEIDCVILRTKNKIPKLLDANFHNMLTYAGTIDGNQQFQQSTYETIVWSQYEKWTSKLPRYFEKNQRLYIINKDFVDNIRIRGVFEDPGLVAKYKTCDGDPCYTDDDEYPISAWMIPIINDLILEKDLRIEAYAPTDRSNDSIGNPEPQQPAQNVRR